MYFFKHKGKQYLDLTGNLILSHNDHLVKARISSAAPCKVLNGRYVINIGKLNFPKKINHVKFGSVYFKNKICNVIIIFF